MPKYLRRNMGQPPHSIRHTYELRSASAIIHSASADRRTRKAESRASMKKLAAHATPRPTGRPRPQVRPRKPHNAPSIRRHRVRLWAGRLEGWMEETSLPCPVPTSTSLEVPFIRHIAKFSLRRYFDWPTFNCILICTFCLEKCITLKYPLRAACCRNQKIP